MYFSHKLIFMRNLRFHYGFSRNGIIVDDKKTVWRKIVNFIINLWETMEILSSAISAF